MGIETLAIASIATSALGAGVSAMGQAQQASASAAQSSYMAQVARNNQEIMERNAKLAEQQGRVEEDKQRLQTQQVIAKQRVGMAAQGGDINSGSNLDIVGDTASAGEFDALTIRSNAALKAYGFRTQGASAGAQAGLYDMVGANSSSPFGVGASLLSGAGSVAEKWDAWRTKGAFATGSPGGLGAG